MDEGNVPENIYFFYGGESDNFYRALEFVGLSPMNKEFGAFLMSDLGRQVMTENKLSIHVESGDVFYKNYNTGGNFITFITLFYRFNDYIKAYGNSRHKIKHTWKMLDTVGMQKIAEKSKQFLIEKIIHSVEFENPYFIEIEKKKKQK